MISQGMLACDWTPSTLANRHCMYRSHLKPVTIGITMRAPRKNCLVIIRGIKSCSTYRQPPSKVRPVIEPFYDLKKPTTSASSIFKSTMGEVTARCLLTLRSHIDVGKVFLRWIHRNALRPHTHHTAPRGPSCCPCCGLVVQLPRNVAAGQLLRCPRCHHRIHRHAHTGAWCLSLTLTALTLFRWPLPYRSWN